MTRDEIITRMFTNGATYSEIGDHLGVTRNSIASSCRKLGLRRNPDAPRKPRAPQPPRISAEEQAEREQDHRDLDMLADIREGHSVNDTARHWGVSKSYILRMKEHVRRAA